MLLSSRDDIRDDNDGSGNSKKNTACIQRVQSDTLQARPTRRIMLDTVSPESFFISRMPEHASRWGTYPAVLRRCRYLCKYWIALEANLVLGILKLGNCHHASVFRATTSHLFGCICSGMHSLGKAGDYH